MVRESSTQSLIPPMVSNIWLTNLRYSANDPCLYWADVLTVVDGSKHNRRDQESQHSEMGGNVEARCCIQHQSDSRYGSRWSNQGVKRSKARIESWLSQTRRLLPAMWPYEWSVVHKALHLDLCERMNGSHQWARVQASRFRLTMRWSWQRLQPVVRDGHEK